MIGVDCALEFSIADASRTLPARLKRMSDGKCVRVTNLAGCLLLFGILTLPCDLLDEFVRYFVANRVLPECQEEPVAV